MSEATSGSLTAHHPGYRFAHPGYQLRRSQVERKIEIEDPQRPEVLAMLADSDSWYAKLYPAASNHLLDASALATPDVTFLVLRVSGRAVGFGVVVRRDATFG